MKYIIDESEVRVYSKLDSCFFKKNNDEYGGLSNMATNYPIWIGEVSIRTTEALYQACRFPFEPEIQKQIILEPSPMKVKMISNANKTYSRKDWDDVKLKVMRWCINIKLAQNLLTFGELLNQTGEKCIVENSSKDNFWGAVPDKDQVIFKGKNALGRLLMELRQKFQSRNWIDLLYINPPNIPDFLLYSESIPVIDERFNYVKSLLKFWNTNSKNFKPDLNQICDGLNNLSKMKTSNLGVNLIHNKADSLFK